MWFDTICIGAKSALSLASQIVLSWLGLFEQVRAIYKWSGCRLIMPLREAVG